MPETALLKTALAIAHLFGVAVGAGGAFMSDAMFMSSVKDSRFSKTEVRFLKLGSVMIWSGVALLVLSGLGLFSFDPARYLASSKFLAKMTIVTAIVVNGLVFHFWHIPLIHKHMGMHFPTSDEFMRKRSWIMASGAVSFVSWSSAIVLGALRGVPWSYPQIMGLYLAVLAAAVVIAVSLKDVVLSKGRPSIFRE
jgi:hypothetical protein